MASGSVGWLTKPGRSRAQPLPEAGHRLGLNPPHNTTFGEPRRLGPALYSRSPPQLPGFTSLPRTRGIALSDCAKCHTPLPTSGNCSECDVAQAEDGFE